MTAVRAQLEAGTCEAVVAGLARAWNDGDAMEYASYFAEDAELVGVHGMHLRGRQAIAGVCDMLFRSVFRGAGLEYEVSGRRRMNSELVLVHLRLEIHIMRGHRAGEHRVVTSLLMERHHGAWKVVSMHSTKVDTAGA